MYSIIIINMLTCVAVLIFKFYSNSVESHLISGMAVQETNRHRHVSTLGHLTFEGLGGCGLRRNKIKS